MKPDINFILLSSPPILNKAHFYTSCQREKVEVVAKEEEGAAKAKEEREVSYCSLSVRRI